MENVLALVPLVAYFMAGFITIFGLRLLANFVTFNPLYKTLNTATTQILNTIKTANQILTSVGNEDRKLTTLAGKLVTDLEIFSHTVEKHLPIPEPVIPEVFTKIKLLKDVFDQLAQDIEDYNRIAHEYIIYWEQERKTLPWGKLFIKPFPKVAVIPIKKK